MTADAGDAVTTDSALTGNGSSLTFMHETDVHAGCRSPFSCDAHTHGVLNMTNFVDRPVNPQGIGASTPDQVLRYLSRSVNNICYAAPEEQYAAGLIRSLLAERDALDAEVRRLREAQQATAGSPQAPTAQPDELVRLRHQNDTLGREYRRDSQRLAYCLQESLYSAGDFIVGDFEQVPVEQGNYRTAIDKIMGM